jgi:hypothetical protein
VEPAGLPVGQLQQGPTAGEREAPALRRLGTG